MRALIRWTELRISAANGPHEKPRAGKRQRTGRIAHGHGMTRDYSTSGEQRDTTLISIASAPGRKLQFLVRTSGVRILSHRVRGSVTTGSLPPLHRRR